MKHSSLDHLVYFFVCAQGICFWCLHLNDHWKGGTARHARYRLNSLRNPYFLNSSQLHQRKVKWFKPGTKVGCSVNNGGKLPFCRKAPIIWHYSRQNWNDIMYLQQHWKSTSIIVTISFLDSLLYFLIKLVIQFINSFPSIQVFFPLNLHWLLSCWTKTTHTAAAVVNKCLTESKQKKSVFAPRGLWKHFLWAPFHKHSYIDINAMDGCFEKVNTLEITKIKIDINYDTWCWHHDN